MEGIDNMNIPLPASPSGIKICTDNLPLTPTKTVPESTEQVISPNTDNLLNINQPKTPLLGIHQAKKRLLAFCQARQNAAYLSPTSKKKSKQKEFIKQIHEAVNEQEIDDKTFAVKKSLKKGINQENKLKSEEIEFNKKIENANVNSLSQSVFNYKKKKSKSNSRSKSRDREYKRNKHRSPEHNRSYTKRNSVERIKYPENWKDIKKNNYDYDKLKKMRSQMNAIKYNECNDYRVQMLFKTPSVMLNQLRYRGLNGQEKYVPAEYIRYTTTNPVVSYSVNSSNEPCVTRNQLLNFIPKSFRNTFDKLIENKLSSGCLMKPNATSKYRSWYPKNFASIENEALEKSNTSVVKIYLDHEEEIEVKVATNDAKTISEDNLSDEESYYDKISPKKIKKDVSSHEEKKSVKMQERENVIEEVKKKKDESKNSKIIKKKKEKGKKIRIKSKFKKKIEESDDSTNSDVKRLKNKKITKLNENSEEIIFKKNSKNKNFNEISDQRYSSEKEKCSFGILEMEKCIKKKESSPKRSRTRSGSREDKAVTKKQKTKEILTSEVVSKSEPIIKIQAVLKPQPSFEFQSISGSQSDTCGEQTEKERTPDTDEYHSHWESEEDVVSYEKVKANRSWESDEDTFERPLPNLCDDRIKGEQRKTPERSLEMPLTIKSFKRDLSIFPEMACNKSELKKIDIWDMNLPSFREEKISDKERFVLESPNLSSLEHISKITFNQISVCDIKIKEELETVPLKLEYKNETSKRKKCRWDIGTETEIELKNIEIIPIEINKIKTEPKDEENLLNQELLQPNVLENEYEEFMKAVTSDSVIPEIRMEEVTEDQEDTSSSSSTSSDSESSSDSSSSSSSSSYSSSSQDSKKRKRKSFITSKSDIDLFEKNMFQPTMPVVGFTDIPLPVPSPSRRIIPLIPLQIPSTVGIQSPALLNETNLAELDRSKPLNLSSLSLPERKPLLTKSPLDIDDDGMEEHEEAEEQVREDVVEKIESDVKNKSSDLSTDEKSSETQWKKQQDDSNKENVQKVDKELSPRRKSRSDFSPRSLNSPKRMELSPRRHDRSSGSFRRDISPKRHELSPRRRDFSPRNRDDFPRRRELSPKRHDISPRRRNLSPRSPRKYDISPRRRDLSPRRRELSPKRRDISPRRRDSPLKRSPKRRDSPPKRRDLSPRRRDISPRRRDISPKRFDLSPRWRDISPRRRDFSPRRRDISPKRRDLSPRRRDLSPRRRDLSPRRRDISPRRRTLSPRRHDSPPKRDISPRRRDSPLRRELSPRRRDLSPRRRDLSPKRRDLSPRRFDDSPMLFSPRRELSPRRKLRDLSPKSRIRNLSNSPAQKRSEEYTSSSKSPLHSPLDGFKRSLADSTISDDLLPQHNINDYLDSPVYNSQYYQGTLNTQTNVGETTTPASPKRIPLDDRINQVLGIDKDPSKPVSVSGVYDQNFMYDAHYYQQYEQYRAHYEQFKAKSYETNYQGVVAPPIPANKVVQVGNMLHVLPAENLEQKTVVAPPKTASNIVQVGNVLEIVPTVEITSTASKDKQSAEALMKQKNAERKAEREKRRLERERRRKEKEKKRKEKDKRKQMRIKLKTENMIKRALLLETGGEEEGETVETDDLPPQWPPVPIVVTNSTLKPAGKGILITHGVSKINLSGGDSGVDLEKKKFVKFADGICPGEGTSPSGGEELSSPPPALPKEKRFKKTKVPKKTKLPKKKKIKVKIIRKSRSIDDDDSEEDNLPPPSPPPGSPPPHIFPPRMKTHTINNVHPAYVNSILNPPPPPPVSDANVNYPSPYRTIVMAPPLPRGPPHHPSQHMRGQLGSHQTVLSQRLPGQHHV